MKPAKFSHLDADGSAKMVDVGAKPDQSRTAVAAGILRCATSTIRALKDQALPKGDALTVARIAGIQAVKQTSGLIPLCHPLPVNHIGIEFEVKRDHIRIRCSVSITGKTGVEMEALTGVSVAALTLYDMMKAVDKAMVIDGVHVLSKTKK
jgi:cyclic pyranopterin monophosphate synthase